MSMKITGVDYENGRVTNLVVNGIWEDDKDEPQAVCFKRNEFAQIIPITNRMHIEETDAYEESIIGWLCANCKTEYYENIPEEHNFCQHCGAELYY